MNCVIPFCSKDSQAAIRLLKWIRQLGDCPNHTATLVVDCETQWSDALIALKLARLAFKGAELIPTEKPCNYPWPTSANLMFMTAAKNVFEPFLWLEPDAVPLKPKWLDAIEDAYKSSGKSFMGDILTSDQPTLPKQYMSGIGVYPCNAAALIGPRLKGNAWDMDAAELIVSRAAHTNLIHNLFGEMGNPPTFAEKNVPGTNVFCLKQIRPEAVIFHRCKDDSLIRLLSTNGNTDMIVVIPFCGKDADIALKNIQWMYKLSGQQMYDLILAHDQTGTALSKQVEQAAIKAFRSVQRLHYNCRTTGWPQGPNVAFQTIAKHMQCYGRPWLWLEPDAIPLKPDWLNVLQKEYRRARRPFMGPVVPQMGHMNGVGIYPPSTPEIIPRAMRSTSTAWDSDMRDEMITKCHDVGHLIQHCWGIANGCAHPHTGALPHFGSQEDLNRWVLPGAVLFHRCKDGSLIDQLEKR